MYETKYSHIIPIFMNKLTVVTCATKTVGCTMTGSLKFPKYFSWSFLVENVTEVSCQTSKWCCRPTSKHALHEQSCTECPHDCAGEVRMCVWGVLPAWSPLRNVHQSVTNKSAQSRSWRSRRHFQDWDLTYHHSGRDSEPSPRRVCTVTCCRKACCALGADYYGMQGGEQQLKSNSIFMCHFQAPWVEFLNVFNIQKWQETP